MAGAEDAVEYDFLGFPDQRHCHGQRQQNKKDHGVKAVILQQKGGEAKAHGQIGQAQETKVSHGDKQQRQQ
jgi:hypothetical protein